MSRDHLAKKTAEKLYSNDRFSQLLGIEIKEVSPGRCVLEMRVRADMMNGFNIAHGRVTFSLADSALAFASNSHGRLSVALETSMTYPASVKLGDVLTAVAEEINLTNKVGVYQITITNQHNVKVGLFNGTVYRTSKELLSGDGRVDTGTLANQ